VGRLLLPLLNPQRWLRHFGGSRQETPAVITLNKTKKNNNKKNTCTSGDYLKEKSIFRFSTQ
jgi:hypothetical protein